MKDDVSTDPVLSSRRGHVGRITLNRPKSLNALSHQMILIIEAMFEDQRADGSIDLMIVDSSCAKAFCAGGDISALHQWGISGDYDNAARFWADEYRLNAKLALSSKPMIAFMGGVVMGGGVGLAAHVRHRVVDETSLIAMPECSIGLVPDVGASLILSRAPGYLGEFLSLTGWRMNGEDAIFAGFADYFVPQQNKMTIATLLEDWGDVSVLDEFQSQKYDSDLQKWLPSINRHFEQETVLECVQSLERDKSSIARRAATKIRKACPLAVATTFSLIRHVRAQDSILDALAAEYRVVNWIIANGDFVEGIRAQIIEKDKSPNWKFGSLEDVPDSLVAEILASELYPELSLRG